MCSTSEQKMTPELLRLPWPGLRGRRALKFRSFSSSTLTPARTRAVVPNTFTGFAQFVSKNPTFFHAAIDKQNEREPSLEDGGVGTREWIEMAKF